MLESPYNLLDVNVLTKALIHLIRSAIYKQNDERNKLK